jgi:hypothetical protein
VWQTYISIHDLCTAKYNLALVQWHALVHPLSKNPSERDKCSDNMLHLPFAQGKLDGRRKTNVKLQECTGFGSGLRMAHLDDGEIQGTGAAMCNPVVTCELVAS